MNAYNHATEAMATGGDYPDEKLDNTATADLHGRDGRSSEEGNVVTATGESLVVDEKKLIRKLDLHLIPIVMLTYLLSFLDR